MVVSILRFNTPDEINIDTLFEGRHSKVMHKLAKLTDSTREEVVSAMRILHLILDEFHISSWDELAAKLRQNVC